MKQIRTWSHVCPTDQVTARFILENRAGQVVRLFGYKIDSVFPAAGDFTDKGDQTGGVQFLQCNPLAPAATMPVNSEITTGLVRHKGNVGALYHQRSIEGPTNVSVASILHHHTSGWVPLGEEGILYPGLWYVASVESVVSSGVGVGMVTLLFDWVTQTPVQVAALHTMYGIDSVDFADRIQGTDIDFTRMMGDAVSRGIVVG